MMNQKACRDIIDPKLQIVAWEITRTCNLFCSHCRASAQNGKYDGELSTEECFRVIDQIGELARPILILSGGEPLMRKDVFDIGRYASEKGFRVVMGTNGTLIDQETAARIKQVPMPRISVSIDFPSPELQDEFRGQNGAYEAAISGIKNARAAGIEIQINSTITRMNARFLPDLIDLALKLGAVAFHPFMLVPTGRGKGLAEKELSPEEYEAALQWICKKQAELGNKIAFKPTDAPHYYRVMSQCGLGLRSAHGHSSPGDSKGHPQGLNMMTRGCLAGLSYCFISHTGKVQGCGYLDIEAGDLRRNSFPEVWMESPLFRRLRDLSNLEGKCGYCEYKRLCGGCRARAYETTGNYLASEPYCIYQPEVRPERNSEIESSHA